MRHVLYVGPCQSMCCMRQHRAAVGTTQLQHLRHAYCSCLSMGAWADAICCLTNVLCSVPSQLSFLLFTVLGVLWTLLVVRAKVRALLRCAFPRDCHRLHASWCRHAAPAQGTCARQGMA